MGKLCRSGINFMLTRVCEGIKGGRGPDTQIRRRTMDRGIFQEEKIRILPYICHTHPKNIGMDPTIHEGRSNRRALLSFGSQNGNSTFKRDEGTRRAVFIDSADEASRRACVRERTDSEVQFHWMGMTDIRRRCMF